MAFDWNEYINLANSLKTGDECAKRSAVSRVYYGAFNLARLFAEDRGFVPRDGQDSHKLVWEFFNNKGASLRGVYTNGIRLKDIRKKADYNDEFNDLENDLIAAFTYTRNIITYLPKKPQIKS